ncbi:MAG: cysteine desulfurase, partial [Proteobacteria bacterium]|nr:cysteine desulfurase [Pseudomonadota bacterium]
MNIPTPTSNGVEGLSAGSAPGLPDEATLGRMASEFFRRLPGAPEPSLNSLPSSPNAGGAPAPLPPLQGGEDGVSQSTALRRPNGLTMQSQPSGWGGDGFHRSDLSLGDAPTLRPIPLPASPLKGEEGGLGQFGVPEAYAASLPSVTPPQPPSAFTESLPVSPPGSPYYFIGEASPYAQSGVPAKPENRVVAQSFGLPGQGELLALLADIGNDRKSADLTDHRGNGWPQGQPQNPGNFYFLDAAREPEIAPSARPPFDVNAVRRDFPILQERVNGKPLVWFDNAATTQKPQSVIDRLAYFYAHENSNIHRAAHELAARATDAYEAARNKVQRFLGAGSADEIIFVRGATEAINLVAKTWGVQNIGEGDEIVVSLLEHHANIVPWQQLAAQVGAKIRVIPVDDSGQLKLDELQKLLNARTKLVSVTQVSNALGTVTPIKQVIDMAHAAGAKVLVDGAQSVSHLRVNVQALDADFFVFSGHKIFGPTGIGVVYGKAALLEQMPPWQGGGNMIADVTFEKTLFQPAPSKFEAGTGNIADAVGLGAALDYVERIGIENIARYEHDLLVYATRGLSSIPGVRL